MKGDEVALSVFLCKVRLDLPTDLFNLTVLLLTAKLNSKEAVMLRIHHLPHQYLLLADFQNRISLPYILYAEYREITRLNIG
jgi:hypothetical protein